MAYLDEVVDAVYAYSRRPGPLTARELFSEKLVIPEDAMWYVTDKLAARMRQEERNLSLSKGMRPVDEGWSRFYKQAGDHINEYVAQQEFAAAHREFVRMSEMCRKEMGQAGRRRDVLLQGIAISGLPGGPSEAGGREFAEALGSAVNDMDSIYDGVRSNVGEMQSLIAEGMRLGPDKSAMSHFVDDLTHGLLERSKELGSALETMRDSVAKAESRYSENTQSERYIRQLLSGERPMAPGPAPAGARVQAHAATGTAVAAALRSASPTRAPAAGVTRRAPEVSPSAYSWPARDSRGRGGR
ncbi:hypothetical protein KQY30_15375 [Streptomyces sp. GMY02]|uniref:hypothetical protein n=1 Tax=Streptomyces sp. GMY02 TaxID=1333528 RepID=UPI001C2BBD82|nr:hypothetical protein [Streptomyces sp. GMY02]QXE35437.1 hypothetical protein KQY30_15375 [Streptomyces sp. GMY02]